MKHPSHIIARPPAGIPFPPFMSAIVALLLAAVTAGSLGAQVYPLSENRWDNPEFVKRFLGSYGVHTRVEPEITREESEFFQGLVETIDENIEQAIAALRRRTTAESSAALDYTLASLLLQQGGHEEAVRHYQTAIRKFPNFMRAYKNLGLAYLQLDEHAAAIPHLVKAIELGDGDGNTYGLLAYAYLNEGKPQSALDAYRIAYLLRPENRDWKIGKAHALGMVGNHRESVAILGELIEERPEHQPFWLSRANALISLGEEAQAAAHLELVKRMDMADASSFRLLGDIYMNEQLPELALDNYLAALRAAGRLPVTLSVRTARNLTRFGAYGQATVFIGEVLEVHAEALEDTQRVELYNIQAEIALGQGEDERAAEILEEVVRVDPLNGEALILLGNYHTRRQDFEEAEFYYERAQSISRYHVDALIQHARMRVAQRNYGKAVDLLEEAQSLRPRRNVGQYLNAVRSAYEASL